MGETLSRKLNFRVNNYQILLGKNLVIPDLNMHGIEKPGFWPRLLLRPAKGELLFLSKNCKLTYLTGEQHTIFPVVDKKNKDRVIFGTTAYLWYKKNKLSRFGFQLIQNQSIVATTIFEEFLEKINETIDQPVASSKGHTIWEVDGQKLVLEIPVNSRYGFIHLMFRE